MSQNLLLVSQARLLWGYIAREMVHDLSSAGAEGSATPRKSVRDLKSSKGFLKISRDF